MEFKCTKCGACCTNLDSDRIVLTLREDRIKIATALNLSEATFVEGYCKENTALTESLGHAAFELKASNGRCVFLGEDNLCVVHPVKPYQCRFGPENFLQTSMKRDYDCMKGVKLNFDPKVEDEFFNRLLNGE